MNRFTKNLNLAVCAAAAFSAASLSASIAVSDVTAKQRSKTDGNVDISFNLGGTASRASAKITIFDNDGQTNLPVRTLALSGSSEVGNPVKVVNGPNRLVWDAYADLGRGLYFPNLTAKVTATEYASAAATVANGRYMVIDLEGGDRFAASFREDVPEGGWGEEFKTTKLVLRQVPAGTYQKGNPKDPVGTQAVTISKPFYMAVFELTQMQAYLINGREGDWPSYGSAPVRGASYADACQIATNLMQKAGLAFDLPTDDQWEYACRAGTTTDFNNGTNLTSDDMDPNMQILGYYEYNGYGGPVGMFLPNAWGLYDMHGGVPEWAKDYFRDVLYGPYVDEYNGHVYTNVSRSISQGVALRGSGDYGYTVHYEYGSYYGEWRISSACNCCSWAGEMVEGEEWWEYRSSEDGVEHEPSFSFYRRADAVGGIRLIRP